MSELLLIDDDRELCELLGTWLVQEGFSVRASHDGAQARRALAEQTPDAVVLDVMLPDGSGLELLKQLRGDHPDLPVLMLSARGEPLDRILGLELGADDYLAKPFNPRELLARIKAVLRRQAPLVPGAPAGADEVVTFGDYQLFLATRELKKGDEVHMLTTGEFAVLKALVQHAREPLTRDKLMNLARGREWDALERSIDVQISRLRRLIEPDPSKPRYIQTVWGVGYVFVPDGNARKA